MLGFRTSKSYALLLKIDTLTHSSEVSDPLLDLSVRLLGVQVCVDAVSGVLGDVRAEVGGRGEENLGSLHEVRSVDDLEAIGSAGEAESVYE